MASIVKRGTSYQVFIAKQGVRKTGTFKTKAAAVAWANDIETKIHSGKEQGTPNILFGAVMDRYMTEISSTKKRPLKEKTRLSFLKQDPIASTSVRELDSVCVNDWQLRQVSRGVSSGTIRRDWGMLSHVCTVAAKHWKWLSHNPFKDVKKPKSPKARCRRVSDREIALILHCGGYTQESKLLLMRERVCAVFLFAIETAMRSIEITELTWDRVYLDQRYVHIPDSKNSDARDVPLTHEATRILKQVEGVDPVRVFAMDTTQRDSNWRKLKGQSGIEGLCFHDTRHEGTTRLASKMGVLDLARTTGHRDLKSLLVYYNKSAADIAKDLHKEMT